MNIIDITQNEKEHYNKVVTHPLQAFEWGEFRKKTGVTVIRKGLEENAKIIDGFQLTLHKIPKTPYNIGYLPKGKLPSQELLTELYKIGKEHNCVCIQLEPDIEKNSLDINSLTHNSKFTILPSVHPLFTKYTFILDLTKSEEELLKEMHPKTRYNIRVAQKHGVVVTEDNSDNAFTKYLELTEETTKRQKFYAHTKKYHELMWNTLKVSTMNHKLSTHQLSAHLFTATYQHTVLNTWVLFIFKDTIYYPYGASSSEYRNVMASNLIMWEAIKYGKKLGLKKFDMWGAMGPEPDAKDPWFGFHRFKQGYGARHVEFIGSFDLVINPTLYNIYKIADKLRWFYLKLRKR
jgi:lipid II:glycine glycyltransferase (peptidoglycan interpeptide bridge formation enzyme)